MAEQRGLSRQNSYQEALDSIEGDFDLSFATGLSEEEVREHLPFLQAIEDTIPTILSVLEAVQAVVDFVTEVLEFLANIIGLAVDLFEAVITLLREVLGQIQDLFSGTSINAMYHFPTSYKAKRNPSEILYDLGMAYLDKNDKNAPVATRNNFAAAIVFMFSFPNLQAIIEKLKALLALFKGLGSDLITGITNLNNSELGENTTHGSSGMAPDFDFGISLLDIPPVKKIYDSIESLLSILSKGLTIGDRLRAIIDAVKRRLQRIRDLVEEIIQIISSVLALFALGEGTNILIAKGKGTNLDYANAIINAPNHPDYPRVELGDRPPRARATTIDADIGVGGLFSGAFLLHMQVGVGDNEERLNTLISLFTKQIDQAEKDLASDFEQVQQKGDRMDSAIKGRVTTGWTQVEQ